MFNYANGFNISAKKDNSEVLIQFIQNSPAYNGKESSDEVQQEVVSSVVMCGTLAKQLVDTLNDLLAENNSQS